MSVFRYELEVVTTGQHTEEELIEFLKFSLGVNGGISMINPFVYDDTDASITDVSI